MRNINVLMTYKYSRLIAGILVIILLCYYQSMIYRSDTQDIHLKRIDIDQIKTSNVYNKVKDFLTKENNPEEAEKNAEPKRTSFHGKVNQIIPIETYINGVQTKNDPESEVDSVNVTPNQNRKGQISSKKQQMEQKKLEKQKKKEAKKLEIQKRKEKIAAFRKEREEKDKLRNKGKGKEKKKKFVKSDIWPPFLEPSDAEILKNLNYSRYTPEEAEFVKERLPEMIRRARRVDRVCSRNVDLMKQKYAVPLVWDTKHQPNIVWCPNYKVASTTWMTNFLRLAHFNDDNPEIQKLPPKQQDRWKYHVRYGARHPVMFELYPAPEVDTERVSVFQNAIRMMIVRHPFARILSAFRDKMQKMRPLPLFHKFRELQKEIIQTYRKEEEEEGEEESSPYPTFSEFIQYVIDSTAELRDPNDWNRKVKSWTPFWSQCNVCSLDFNVIMKLETMAEDEKFLTIVSDLKELKEHTVWRHLNNASSSDLASSFYNQITTDQMKTLRNRYQLDFDMYGYDIDDYLQIAKDAT